VWASVYTSDPNPVLQVSAAAAARLAGLGLGIDFDVYCGSSEGASRDNRRSPPQEPTSGDPPGCDS
jgi:hypothetical protein